MSRRNNPSLLTAQRAQASVFAALGDRTRLQLLGRLSLGEPCSISELSSDAAVTRQAITKHLEVLENAGLVRSERFGRETRFEFVPKPIEEMQIYLETVAKQWDAALGRLKKFVE
jgi:DNA-binding transcriptional ArsR family regulator